MLYQLHWQFKNGKTEMRMQFRIDDKVSQTRIKQELARANADHPLPAGAMWMLCSEKSEKFVMMAAQ